jgi:hypothetical protein
MYVEPFGKKEINIANDVKKKTGVEFEESSDQKCSIELFDPSVTDLELMLNTDSFKSYRATPEFASLCKNETNFAKFAKSK